MSHPSRVKARALRALLAARLNERPRMAGPGVGEPEEASPWTATGCLELQLGIDGKAIGFMSRPRNAAYAVCAEAKP